VRTAHLQRHSIDLVFFHLLLSTARYHALGIYVYIGFFLCYTASKTFRSPRLVRSVCFFTMFTLTVCSPQKGRMNYSSTADFENAGDYFFCGQITLWAISRDILRNLRPPTTILLIQSYGPWKSLFWAMKWQRAKRVTLGPTFPRNGSA